MGCVSSADKDVTDDREDKAKRDHAAQQRRRLSVAPEHVGDYTTGVELKKPAKSPGPEAHHGGAGNDWQYATLSKKGYVPYNLNKVNQDRDIVAIGIDGDAGISLYGVMDGHGEFGHEVSAFVKATMPEHFARLGAAKIRKDPHKAIKEATASVCARLAESEISTAFSGTTAIYSVVIDGKLYTANIGDSRCCLCRLKGDGWEAMGLSEDQKPDNPEEKKRILAAGGRVETLPGPPGEDNGPYRVWLKEVDVPGLAMARSIGDEVSHTVGVIDIPEIREHQLDKSDYFALWASDGVWEFLSNEDVMKIVYDQLKKEGDSMENLDKCAKLVVAASLQQWQRHEDVVDDITCVIVKFRDRDA